MDAIVIFSKYYFYFLPVVIFHVHASNFDSYTIRNIESDETCALNSLQSRTLKLNSKFGIIVQENYYFDRGSLSGKYPYKCNFIVDAADNVGIFAVIQEMKLRKNDTTGECIDYVQFRHSNSIQLPLVDISVRKDDRPWKAKMCGNINAKELDLTSINFPDPMKVLPYAFMDPGGKVDVRIYVANVTISPNTELDLRIAFTAYHPCSTVSNSAFKKCNSQTCIWGEFFNDDILNCPFMNCADIKRGCQVFHEDELKRSSGLATKIMVGAVAGVFTMFIVFIMFLWLFRHCAMCWNGPASSAESLTQMRPVPTVEEIQPTDPPRTLSIDKDLPPSYESLFPNP